MNRQQRRKSVKKESVKKYSLRQIQRSYHIAMEMKKHTKGHLFSKTLKDRCVFCGVTQKTKKECDYWFMTFMDRTQSILLNPDFYTNDNIQALWLQHGEQYQNIRLPLNLGEKPDAKKD